MGSNHEKVRQGERILLFALSDYVCKELKQTYGADWWEDGVLDILYDDQKRDLPLAGDWGTLVDSLDMAGAGRPGAGRRRSTELLLRSA